MCGVQYILYDNATKGIFVAKKCDDAEVSSKHLGQSLLQLYGNSMQPGESSSKQTPSVPAAQKVHL